MLNNKKRNKILKGGYKMGSKQIMTSIEKARVKNKIYGCPANNTRCKYLIFGRCSLEDPDLCYRLEKKDGYCCGSFSEF